MLGLPLAVEGGISGFEDDAEVEHGLGKGNARLFDCSWPAPQNLVQS